MNNRKKTYEELLQENKILKQELAEANKILANVISLVERMKKQNAI